MEPYKWIISLPSLLAISILGMLIHFLKQQIKGETVTEIRDYFSTHFKSTFIALVVTIASTLGYYFQMKTGQAADIVVTFLLGYMCDSTLNKWTTEK